MSPLIDVSIDHTCGRPLPRGRHRRTRGPTVGSRVVHLQVTDYGVDGAPFVATDGIEQSTCDRARHEVAREWDRGARCPGVRGRGVNLSCVRVIAWWTSRRSAADVQL